MKHNVQSKVTFEILCESSPHLTDEKNTFDIAVLLSK